MARDYFVPRGVGIHIFFEGRLVGLIGMHRSLKLIACPLPQASGSVVKMSQIELWLLADCTNPPAVLMMVNIMHSMKVQPRYGHG